MPKAIVHPHPVYDFKCSDCIYWHPLYTENFAIRPGTGDMFKAADILKRGENLTQFITDRRSMCFHDPEWRLVGEDHYCSHFKAAKVY